MSSALYLPSTPLNILVSAAVALQYPQEAAALLLIDQKQCDNSPYLKALHQWHASPFETVDCLPERVAGLGKRESRKVIFHRLSDAVQKISPSKVYVGSDRRIEFQFVMQQLKKHGKGAEGVYLDDGLYTYAGRPFVWWKDWVNAGLKKLAYGLWWQEPETVGASSWIQSAFVFQPKQVHPALASKVLHALPVAWFTHKAMIALSEALFAQFQLETDTVAQLDAVILVPHPNNIAKMPGYETQLKQGICQLLAEGKRVAAKYHPRTEQGDPLGLHALGVKVLLPKQLAFEFILPVLQPGTLVQGDVGTAVLTSRWLRPDLSVRAVLNTKDPFQQRFLTLMQQFEVEVKPL